MQNATARRLQADDDRRTHAARPHLRVVEPGAPMPPVGERRTIRITGQAAPPRRRSARQEQIVSRPDRVALYAVLLGLFLVLMAIVTAQAGA